MTAWLKIPLNIRIASLLLILAGLAFVHPSHAIQPGWYAPLDADGRGTGQGILVECNLQNECAVFWAAYRTTELQGLSEAASELITVVETSTAILEAADPRPVLDTLQALRETPVNQQVWLMSQENCPVEDQVCEFTFARTESTWFADQFEFLPVEITAEIEETADSILVDFDAILLQPEICNTGPGGLIQNDCVGVEEFFLIAR